MNAQDAMIVREATADVPDDQVAAILAMHRRLLGDLDVRRKRLLFELEGIDRATEMRWAAIDALQSRGAS